MNNNMEKRNSPRIRMGEEFSVIDINGGTLGSLANISQGGFMLLASHPLVVNRLFQLRLQPTDTQSDDDSIELGAECLWCQEAAEPGHYWAGFQIIDISDQAGQRITQLLGGAD